ARDVERDRIGRRAEAGEVGLLFPEQPLGEGVGGHFTGLVRQNPWRSGRALQAARVRDSMRSVDPRTLTRTGGARMSDNTGVVRPTPPGGSRRRDRVGNGGERTSASALD